MDSYNQLQEDVFVCRLDRRERKLTPCTLVIFGASGDLTTRKLIPALYHLHKAGLMPTPFRIIGFARRQKTNAEWHEELFQGMQLFARTRPISRPDWDAFAAQNVVYQQGDFGDANSYQRLQQTIEAAPVAELQQNILFYLATPSYQVAVILENLARINLLHPTEMAPANSAGWRRLVVEKPFGNSLKSARALSNEFSRFTAERNIFRIDHYLGKETVQNMMLFRFSNSVFEPLWDRRMMDHVQITVSEKMGVGSRGGYYEEAGAARDMLQNHLLQVLALAAMEPPVSLDAEAIRDEKIKLISSIRLPQPEDIVRGQYTAGKVDGEDRPAYRSEPKIAPQSNVETYVAARLFVDNWRWSGVPFYLRTGKNLPKSVSEIRFQFKQPPYTLFAAQCGTHLDQNSITLRLQPDEGITLHINGKVPGTSTEIRPVRMKFSYNTEFGAYTPEAYERLLLDAMAGDATLFIRRDEVETAWSIVDTIRGYWYGKSLEPDEFYSAGTWGPQAADKLLCRHCPGYPKIQKPAIYWRNPD